ncbi:MAG: hypothetical protein EBU85_00690 [Actinobacteria bacterium]|nr:hypothetical protein [Actinomycetota bacterium]
MNIGHRARLVAGVVVGLVVAGGSAYATTVDTSGTETAACITPSKYIRVLSDGAECRRRETAISLPSMDTVDALSGAINENSDMLDETASTLEQATSDIADLQDLTNDNGANIFNLQGDFANEVDRATSAEAELAANFDNYYTIDDVDGALGGIYDGFSAVYDELSNRVTGDDVAIGFADIQGQLELINSALDQAGTDLSNAVDELNNSIGALIVSTSTLSDRADAADAFAADVAASMSGFQSQVDTLTTGQAAVAASASANADAITSLTASVASAFADRDATIAALTARVTALEAAVAALTPAP